MKWVLNTTKDRSIESRLKDITVPDLNNLSMINEGFKHYNEMCVSCHGAPGLEETEVSVGLNPTAPYLVKVAKEIDAKELFWITKNGIKMTGMPAWGKTHSDEKIWDIVAFVKKLPDMTLKNIKKWKVHQELWKMMKKIRMKMSRKRIHILWKSTIIELL